VGYDAGKNRRVGNIKKSFIKGKCCFFSCSWFVYACDTSMSERWNRYSNINCC
jgi:hypothetical protein